MHVNAIPVIFLTGDASIMSLENGRSVASVVQDKDTQGSIFGGIASHFQQS